MHNSELEGRPAIVHTDISPAQYIKVGGRFKLNDFNRARFLRWSISKNQTCTYRVSKNPGWNRSPEEYMYLDQTEKVDVYSLGNIFYMLLQEEWPFQDMNETEAIQQIIIGARPSIDKAVWESQDPVDQALRQAMIVCHVQNATERVTARQVEAFLLGGAQILD